MSDKIRTKLYTGKEKEKYDKNFDNIYGKKKTLKIPVVNWLIKLIFGR